MNLSEIQCPPVRRKAYIVGPVFDSVLFIFTPLLSLGLGWIMSHQIFQKQVHFVDRREPLYWMFYITLTQAHLIVTVARTHANRAVFRKYWLRFTVVPVGLFASIMLSGFVAAAGFVLMTFWDVYHSSMQTFGLARIYGAKAGELPHDRRWADLMLNLLLYAGPVFGGAMLVNHLASFATFSNLEPISVGAILFDPSRLVAVPESVLTYQHSIKSLLLTVGAVGILAYVSDSLRRYRAGKPFPWQKTALLLSTGITSVVAWGFNSFGMAFLIVNVFHAVQYFALVWTTEKRNLAMVAYATESHIRMAILFAAFLLAPIGLALVLIATFNRAAFAVLIVCALMHFWWDGFIWSVRKKQHLEVAA